MHFVNAITDILWDMMLNSLRRATLGEFLWMLRYREMDATGFKVLRIFWFYCIF